MSSKWLMKQQMLEEQDRIQDPVEQLDEETIQKIEQESSQPSDPDRIYIWVAGDNIWQVSQRLNFEPYMLLEHNNIEDYNSIDPGFVLHLPEARPVELREPIRYELYPKPKTMYVSHTGGTHKVFFGNVKEWKDIKPTGTIYPQYRTVEISGIAKVPVGNELATFYIDELALGDYRETGVVRYTIGFNHTHLTEGNVPQAINPNHLVLKKIKPTISKIEQKIAEDALKEGEPTKKSLDVQQPNIYKTTFLPFNEERESVAFMTTRDMVVDEMDTRRESKSVPSGTKVLLLGTFVKDHITYGRPTGSVKSGLWYGIDMKYLQPLDDGKEDDEMYNYEVDLPTRVAMGSHARLSNWEKWVQVPVLKTANYYIKARDWLKNKNKEN